MGQIENDPAHFYFVASLAMLAGTPPITANILNVHPMMR
jgi:hypothetical protein